jgi:hypothetical protein
MDETQEGHERAEADRFICWYNACHKVGYRFYARGNEPPDFIYRHDSREMLLEVTAVYYDADNAKMLWQNARALPEAAKIWTSKWPDRKMVDSLNVVLENKCKKRYPVGCLLLAVLYPDVTSAEEFEHLLPEIQIPPVAPFASIYIAGDFPVSSSSAGSGGYHCWKVA